MSNAWSDDDAFKNLAKNKGLGFHRVSYACFSLNCIDCDGTIHYKLLKEIRGYRNGKFYGPYRNAQTGEMVDNKEFEEVMWDTEQESVMLEGGVSQNPMNTPEGSKCQCHHCHGRPGYDEWKARGGKPKEGLEPTSGFAKDEYAPGKEPPK